MYYLRLLYYFLSDIGRRLDAHDTRLRIGPRLAWQLACIVARDKEIER